jgi:two-component system chemotaxis response regulator CheY
MTLMTFPPDASFLIVDDMTGIRLLFKKSLKAFGYTDISEAPDVPSAIKLIEERAQSGKPFDLIFADYRMPGASGIDLLTHVRTSKNMKKVGFIMVTAESDKSIVVEAIHLGVDGYIVKPYSDEILKRKLSVAFDLYNKRTSKAS